MVVVMTKRRSPGYFEVVVLIATLALATALVRWADAEFVRTHPPTATEASRPVARPGWVGAWQRPFDRFEHDQVFGTAALTVGMGIILARRGRWTRRGLRQPGSRLVLICLIVGGALFASLLAIGLTWQFGPGIRGGLRDLLNFRLPGLVVGAWVVGGSRRRSWRRADGIERAARVVGGLWLLSPALFIMSHAVFA